ncbi:hypothetical protein MUP65_01215 [Patescibacteria group bacterium]|nr:hypothetical protein [Patescibacteria group bacterium]
MNWSLTLFQPYLAQAMARVVELGVPESFFAYLLVLPFLASVIGVARHLFGLATYGTFLPIIISLLWLEMGLDWGIIVTVFLLLWSWLARYFQRKVLIGRFRVNYLPRMAILLMLIGLGVLLLGIIPSWSIFTAKEGIALPLVILIVVIQNMIETQISLPKKESQEMLVETLLFALVGFLFFSWPALHSLVIRFPAFTLLFTLGFNFFVGRYVGFRFLEYRRFRSIIKKTSSDR